MNGPAGNTRAGRRVRGVAIAIGVSLGTGCVQTPDLDRLVDRYHDGQPSTTPVKVPDGLADHDVRRLDAAWINLVAGHDRSTLQTLRDFRDQFGADDKIFHFWINSSFVDDHMLTLQKLDIDKAHKDKKHRKFLAEFKLELMFRAEDVITTKQSESAAAAAAAATATT